MSARLRVAIAGCGAVTERYYLPALTARAERLVVAGFYDSDSRRMAAVARALPDASSAASFEALVAQAPDLVILASPPAVHAAQAMAALGAGCHVLCEKPMASRVAEAGAMVAAADEAHRLLAVNMIRRHFPATGIVTRLRSSGMLGPLRSAHVFEGGPFRWPIGDQRYFLRAVSGGGVLADIGPHVLDLLLHWIGDLALVDCQDDALGGVEANVALRLRCGPAPVTIRLSRDWSRPNLIELVFESAAVRWSADDPAHIGFSPAGAGEAWRMGAEDFSFAQSFVAQLDAMADAVIGWNRDGPDGAGRPAALATGRETLPVVALIEQAYGIRTPMAMPWLHPMECAAHG